MLCDGHGGVQRVAIHTHLLDLSSAASCMDERTLVMGVGGSEEWVGVRSGWEGECDERHYRRDGCAGLFGIEWFLMALADGGLNDLHDVCMSPRT